MVRFKRLLHLLFSLRTLFLSVCPSLPLTISGRMACLQAPLLPVVLVHTQMTITNGRKTIVLGSKFLSYRKVEPKIAQKPS